MMRFAMEFGMKLAGDEERVIGKFNDLDQLSVRRKSTKNKTCVGESLAVSVIELVTVPVPFLNDESSVQAGGPGSDDELTRLGSKAHGSAFPGHLGLLIQHRDNRVGCVGIKLG